MKRARPAPSPDLIDGGARRSVLGTLLPSSATPDAARLVSAHALRSFADGFVSVVLASYLSGIGFSPLQVGAIVTGTMLGSAMLTLAVGLFGHRVSRRAVLLGASALMFITGVGFFGVTAFWPLLLIAVAGTLNPSAGDVSVFLPVEQAILPETAADRHRTALFARFNLGDRFAGALGALASAVPAIIAHRAGWDLTTAQRAGFLLYAGMAVAAGLIYATLTPAVDLQPSGGRRAPLSHARGVVLRLAALFTLD
ncbi:MAG: MFS transporter, partial [Dehalococcoidia bacterium]